MEAVCLMERPTLPCRTAQPDPVQPPVAEAPPSAADACRHQPPRPRRGWWPKVWRQLRAATLGVLIVVISMMIFENKLIFIPSKYPEGDWKPQGLNFQDAWFKASDGTRLHGWYVPHPRPAAYILFCHGNAGNITHRADRAELLHDRCAAAVLLFDYRGYGRSEGSPSETGVLDDARAARAWLAQQAGINQRDIIVMGESLGGGVAVDLAAADGARGLILENTFSSLGDVAAYHVPVLPVRYFMRTRLDSLSKIGKYHGPLLQSHGQPDRVVPYKFGQRLFDAANQPKRFISYPTLDHNDPRPATYYPEVARFIEEANRLAGGGG